MNSSDKLCDFINKIGIGLFVNYLNMIFEDGTMNEIYEEFLEVEGDMNLAIIKCIEDDFSYA